MAPPARAPHPATVVQQRPASATAAARPPHPATVVQQQPATATPAARPPHPATVVQQRPASATAAARPPHPATVVQQQPATAMPAAPPPHPATVLQQRPAIATPAAQRRHPATVLQQRPAIAVPATQPPHPATVLQQRPAIATPATRPPHTAALGQPWRRPDQAAPPYPRGAAPTAQRVVLASSVQPMMDLEFDGGTRGFPRPDFRSTTSKTVTSGINQELTASGFNTVARSDYDVAHKVPFEAIRNLVMNYIYDRGSTDANELITKTDALYFRDTSRYGAMKKLRIKLIDLVKHYGHLSKGPMLILDASNYLLTELNSAPDNLGLGIPSENRSIGANPDPVVVAWDPKTNRVTYSPRTDHLDDAWDLTGHLLYDASGVPRSSQITSYFN
ncbi:hypothetical protein WME99_30585 [Sorangium sp. So ce136]|uniref:hypothetical protein n=1 Tax=Sorangium sp. So ce136 TaxID=3133284 RepID=UPI003F0738D6